VFEGRTAAAIARAAEQAGIDVERIVETVADGGPRTSQTTKRKD